MEHRQVPRYATRCAARFFGQGLLAGGNVTNISEDGCRVESTHAVSKGAQLCLWIWFPAHDEPLEVANAVVRWAHGGTFGVKVIGMERLQWRRLQALTDGLSTGSSSPSADLPRRRR